MASEDQTELQLKDDGNDNEFVKLLRNAINPILEKLSVEGTSNVPPSIKPLFFAKLRDSISKEYGEKIEKLIKKNNLNEMSAALTKMKEEQADNQETWRPNRDVGATLQILKDENLLKRKKHLLKLLKAREEDNKLNKKRYEATVRDVKNNFAAIIQLKKDQVKVMQERKDALDKIVEDVFNLATRT